MFSNATAISGVTSLFDVSVIFHMPEFYVREIYIEFMEKWNSTGGVAGVREKYMISVMVANWVTDTDYPNVSEYFQEVSLQNGI